MYTDIKLIDAVLARTLYPDLFPDIIPKQREKLDIHPGDACKVGFASKDGKVKEVMWVDVVGVSITTGELCGYLHNSPKHLTQIEEDDYIEFHPVNVFAIKKDAHTLWDPVPEKENEDEHL